MMGVMHCFTIRWFNIWFAHRYTVILIWTGRGEDKLNVSKRAQGKLINPLTKKPNCCRLFARNKLPREARTVQTIAVQLIQTWSATIFKEGGSGI